MQSYRTQEVLTLEFERVWDYSSEVPRFTSNVIRVTMHQKVKVYFLHLFSAPVIFIGSTCHSTSIFQSIPQGNLRSDVLDN